MEREIEVIDLDDNKSLGGESYHHTGQIIRVSHYGSKEKFFLGDDYEEYSAKDVLIRTIIEHPNNWHIRGDVFKIEDTNGDTLTVWTNYKDIDKDGNDIIKRKGENIYYEWVDCTVIVNHKTKFEMVIKKGSVA